MVALRKDEAGRTCVGLYSKEMRREPEVVELDVLQFDKGNFEVRSEFLVQLSYAYEICDLRATLGRNQFLQYWCSDSIVSVTRTCCSTATARLEPVYVFVPAERRRQ